MKSLTDSVWLNLKPFPLFSGPMSGTKLGFYSGSVHSIFWKVRFEKISLACAPSSLSVPRTMAPRHHQHCTMSCVSASFKHPSHTKSGILLLGCGLSVTSWNFLLLGAPYLGGRMAVSGDHFRLGLTKRSTRNDHFFAAKFKPGPQSSRCVRATAKERTWGLGRINAPAPPFLLRYSIIIDMHIRN